MDEQEPTPCGHVGPDTLPLGEAFRAWSDKAAVERLDEVSKFRDPPIMIIVGPGIGPGTYELGHHEWLNRFGPLNEAFVSMLRSGSLIATGFATPLRPDSRRLPISPGLFELLTLDYKKNEAKAEDLSFILVEVSRPADGRDSRYEAIAAPGDASPAPPQPAFRHNANYSRVWIGPNEFFLTGGLCLIVRDLHAASRTSDPWVENKSLLAAGGYSSGTVAAVFKRHVNPSWKVLIDQRRGFSRLRID